MILDFAMPRATSGERRCGTEPPGFSVAPMLARAATRFAGAVATGTNVFHAVAAALAEALGWRWVAITRLKPGVHEAEMLAWWEDGHQAQPFDYELLHGPCEVVARVGTFCWFDDVALRFPFDEFSRAARIVLYAGAVYRDPDGGAIGHLLAANDRLDARRGEVEQLFSLLTVLMGMELRRLNADERRREAEHAALTDPLTGLGNRRALARGFAACARRHEPSTRLAVIDLDGLKAVNDRLGHAAGDAVLVAFAHALRRFAAPAQAFRVGGDEFAILASGGSAWAELAVLNAAVAARHALAEHVAIAGQGFDLHAVGASVGAVDPSRYAWSLDATLIEADRRMYAHKAARRAAAAP
jgi:diguanylate cyclase (GGDEF)-like protein